VGVRPSIELSRHECRALLASRTVGRIAFQTGNGLRVLPVNYVVLEDRIVFRTAERGVIARSIRASEVAFQVDDLDEQLRAGWSVLAVGRCERVTDPAQLDAIAQAAPPAPWADGTRELHFAVRWKGLSGRRLGDT
jgi:nitroimidazol reductase NimA-like FMN-containing flavoprotein (pyridoxamine 5'-phosphate oxidase superfamily)